MKRIWNNIVDAVLAIADDRYSQLLHERNSYRIMADYNKGEVERLSIELREMSQLKIDNLRKDKIIAMLKRDAKNATASTLVPR